MTNHDEQLKGYEQLCTSYHAIDDFRSKLLGLLPIVSGSGIFLLLSEALARTPLKEAAGARQFLYPIGLFGFVVALGLFCYELYGILKCHTLINAGRAMEIVLGIEQGQFRKRPRSLFYLINEPFAAGLIYPAVLAAWMFLALLFPQSQGNSVQATEPATEHAIAVAIRVFIFGFAFMLVYNLTLAHGRAVLEFVRKHVNPVKT
jgi:predicted cation transporter